MHKCTYQFGVSLPEIEQDDNFEILLPLLAQFGGSIPTQAEVKAWMHERLGCSIVFMPMVHNVPISQSRNHSGCIALGKPTLLPQQV